ncbi:hypothetical protein HPB51_016812 [Rhipicephalus microplus]|uniref:C2H2-type domain-containing protein n=1 Tax=Rhipicephalus microplus TaxID=6941 RepID=A0A9J6DHP3_RHIMP|nr:hypothetical protein HPB51_016812 [Rhipicephalus microplus]
MDIAACEDIPFLLRRVVREELIRLQAGDVHHQCSFAASPEPHPYWMRERHVKNRPRTETANFTPLLPFSPTGRGLHRMSSSRRAAADLRPSSIRPLPEDYFASSQNVPVEHDPSPRTFSTSAPGNVNCDRAVTDDESRRSEIGTMFTKRKNMIRHVRDVHKVTPEINTRVKCDVCGVGLSLLEKYVRHHIATHEFIAEYV